MRSKRPTAGAARLCYERAPSLVPDLMEPQWRSHVPQERRPGAKLVGLRARSARGSRYCNDPSIVSNAMLPHIEQGAGTGIGAAAIVIALHLEHLQVRLLSRSLAVMVRWGLPRCLMTVFLSTP